MKVKFTKLAALLLAGAALFATGCTDYEVDIQKVDKKVDDLTTGKVATLENQVQQLQATVATLETKADHDADIQALRTTISELETALKEDLAAAKQRIAALEAADEAFKTQIAGIENTLQGQAQAIELINGEITQLKGRMDAAEAAIKNINEVLIPGLQAQIDNLNNVVIPKLQQDIKDLQDGKLDRAEFDDYYKKAYEKYTKETIDSMQAAIDALTALTAGFPEDTTIKEYIDAIANEFIQKYLGIVAKAFGSLQAMNEMEGNLLGRLEACETLLAGEWGDKTVKQYLDAEVSNLQDQIDDINNVKIPELDNRISTLENQVNNVILPQLKFALDYEGGLQAYIDDAAYDAYLAACDYADEWASYIFEFIQDLYVFVTSLQERIQSIVYVPDYDDMKITTNMAYIYQPVDNPFEVGVAVMDEPTKITYKILPAQYALWAAYNYEDILEFDVKPVNTRADEEADTAPKMEILGFEWDDDTVDETGLITFIVQPVNIASANFAAAGLKPDYEYGLAVDGEPVTGQKFTWPYGSKTTGYFAADCPAPYWWTDVLKVGVWKADDLKAYQARTAFAASLRLKDMDGGTALAHYVFDDFDGDYDDYFPEYNEVASTYNVLYPAVKEYCVLPEVYKKIETEDGDLDVRKFTFDEYHQKLPYSSLRENPIGEKEEQDPKGYRVILDGAVPAVMVDNKPQGLFPENLWEEWGVHILQDAAGEYIFIPAFTTEFQKFTFNKFMAIADLDENNFITTPKNEDCPVVVGDYAELEMNPEVSASTRKQAVGNLITGFYTFTSSIGKFTAAGDVLITKPQGSISLDAEVKWVYGLDADVDHNIYYNDAPADSYSRTAVAVNIDAEGLAKLDSELGITLDSFKKHTPDMSTYKVTYAGADGEAVELGEDALFNISNVTIKDGKLYADIKGFEFGKVYTVTVTYELEYALIDVTFTFTTVDRNRETITIEIPEYTFKLNGEDYDAANDIYTSATKDFHKDLFAAFVAQPIINEGDPKDFADADVFVGLENNGKEGHLVVVPEDLLEEGEFNSPYILIADDNATLKLTSKELAGSTYHLEDGVISYYTDKRFDVIYVTTYVGQKVKVHFPFTVETPGYDFLHLRYYTFNTDHETEGFVQKRDFADNNGTVKWWTQVNPSYFTSVDPNAVPGDASSRISFRHALADYDVKYINLAELAFNVVDPKDEVMDDEAIAAAHLVATFDYTDETQGVKDLPTVDQILSFQKYADLWVNPTVFYYRTNEKKFIPALGALGIKSGDWVFPINTRFNKAKAAVKFPEEVLDYSTYALVRWTPFQVPPKADGFTIVLDENNIYRVPLFKGMYLKDNRPNGISYYVLNDGEWVVGNVDSWDVEAGTYTTGGNGYVKGVKANNAYHITTTFTYDDLKLPTELQKLLTVEEVDGVPYMVYDYRSEVQFHGIVEIPVTVLLTNPWQEAIKFEYNVYIKGIDD